MEDLKRLRFLAANYPMLQGLKSIPFGLVIVLLALWGNTIHKPTTDLTVPLLIIIVCAILYFVFDRFYSRTFGNVRKAHGHLEWVLSIAGAVVGLAAFAFDVSPLRLPICTLGLVFAVSILFEYFRFTQFHQERFLLLYPVSAAVMAIVSLLPLLGVSLWSDLFSIKSSILGITLFMGILFIIVGVLGHLFLVRNLPPIQEAHNGERS